MMPAPLALQLYTVRDALAADRAATLARVAEQGFQAVELFGVGDPDRDAAERTADARALRRQLDSYGLRVAAAHGLVPVDERQAGVYDELDVLGTDRLIAPGPILVPGFTDEALGSADGVNRFVGALNAAAGLAAARGFRVGYHNHHFEWKAIEDGTPAYDLMVRELDPRVFLEIDVYWVHCAGQNPATVIAAHAERVHLLHLKDGPGVAGEAHVSIGEGVVDNAAAAEAGTSVEWHVVELDECVEDPLVAARTGAEWLVEHGHSTWAT